MATIVVNKPEPVVQPPTEYVVTLSENEMIIIRSLLGRLVDVNYKEVNLLNLYRTFDEVLESKFDIVGHKPDGGYLTIPIKRGE
jgi:hypothetical protein